MNPISIGNQRKTSENNRTCMKTDGKCNEHRLKTPIVSHCFCVISLLSPAPWVHPSQIPKTALGGPKPQKWSKGYRSGIVLGIVLSVPLLWILWGPLPPRPGPDLFSWKLKKIYRKIRTTKENQRKSKKSKGNQRELKEIKGSQREV